MTPTPDPIAAIEREKNRIQGMVRSIDQYRNGDPKAILAGSEAQALYALTDARHDVLVLWDFAVTTGNENVSLARQAAEKDAEHRCQIADMAERFRAVNVVSVIEQIGDGPFLILDRAEKAEARVSELEREIAELRTALEMISAEAKESNEPIGRSVFKALATCGEIADVARRARSLTTERSDAQG